ncbi:hypothetical protein KIF24_31175 [Micromonospora sp. Llam7]|uniref:hypothetical protein n=1 Tax=Micromonospora tarapacensis TaxID=2835305 RepID=UPI001C83059A|nr:hypothetical protein [Micromonospora tarapacensis]MBX7270046.1 hypothetical protein [Micromonospora tarapacensis]
MTDRDEEPERPPTGPLGLDVAPIPDAASDLVEFGQLYWDLLGVTDGNKVVWHRSLNTLYREQGVSIRRSHVIAAAGSRACLKGLDCPECGKPMGFRAREDLERYVRDEVLTQCVECDDNLQRAVALEHAPTAGQRRIEQRRRAQHDLAVHEAQAAWEEAQRAHVATVHPGRAPRDDDGRSASTLRAQLVTLTLLRHRPNDPVVAPVNTWDVPLTPNQAMTEELLGECLSLGLLRIHPESPTRVCHWRQTFATALASVDNDPSRVGQPECDGYLLGWAVWHPPGTAGNDETANRQLHDDLTQRFAGDQLVSADRARLLDLAVELIAAETVRVFESGLRDADLPEVPEQHRATLEAAALHLARLLDLNECLAHADAAVYGAAKAARANPKARRVNMTVHGVNRLADSAQDWYLVPNLDRLPGERAGRNHLSALTWVLFRGVLGIDPFTASRTLAASTLTVGHDAPDAEPPPIDTWLQAVLDLELRSDPHAVYRALQQEAHHQHPAIAVAAESLIELVDRLRAAAGDLRGALAAAVAATALLRTRILLPRTTDTVCVGEYLARAMVQAASAVRHS